VQLVPVTRGIKRVAVAIISLTAHVVLPAFLQLTAYSLASEEMLSSPILSLENFYSVDYAVVSQDKTA